MERTEHYLMENWDEDEPDKCKGKGAKRNNDVITRGKVQFVILNK